MRSRIFLACRGGFESSSNGTPRNPLRLELIDQTDQMTTIEHDPRDQRYDNRRGSGVSTHDENRVGAGSHAHAPTASACMISMARNRRRKISLRMAAMCSVRKSNVNATTMISSGARM